MVPGGSEDSEAGKLIGAGRGEDPRRAGSGGAGQVEALGGMSKAIESGMPKLRIEEAAARKQARIDSKQEVIVGVNKYRLAKEAPLDILSIDNTAVRTKQIERIRTVKAARNDATVGFRAMARSDCDGARRPLTGRSLVPTLGRGRSPGQGGARGPERLCQVRAGQPA